MDEERRHMKMYRDWADIYDALYTAQGQSKDLPLLTSLVREYGGPVLECACGTGRVMIPLAKAGFKVHGIDTSKEMLAVLDKKLRKLPDSVRKRITFERKDMRTFVSPRKFRTCVIAFNSLYHLQNDADIMKFFRRVGAHLKANGVFIIDIFEADPNYVQGRFVLQTETSDGKGRTMRKYGKTVFGNNQVNDGWFRIVIEGRGKRRMINKKFKLRYLTHDQAWKMLDAAGFKVMRVYANYESEPYDMGRQNEKMIFVARKTGKAAGKA
jgi:SAM-dependent methyltransferase